MSRDLPPDSPFSFFQETADRGNPRSRRPAASVGPSRRQRPHAVAEAVRPV